MRHCSEIQLQCGYYSQGCQEDWPGPGQRQKVGACNMNCGRGSGGTPLVNVEILHALKCVLGDRCLRLFFLHIYLQVAAFD